MVLDIAIGQCGLHRASKQLSASIKGSSDFPTADFDRAGQWKSSGSTELSLLKTIKPTIPAAKIFEGFSEGEQPLPSTADCAAHLEFLAALYVLRQRVLESKELDNVFGIKLNKKTVSRKGVMVELKDDTMWTRRQAKWETFVDLAVARFRVWWNALPETFSSHEVTDECPRDLIPPLDILMVWHSFLLNPRWFLRSCDGGKRPIYKIKFPWRHIHTTFNSDDSSLPFISIVSSTSITTTLLNTDLVTALLKSQNSLSTSLASGPISLNNLFSNDILQYFNNGNVSGGLCSGVGKDLKDAVLRQTSFVDKMWDKYWIGSPALEGTIRRARNRYTSFLNLFKLYPSTMFVPTLDIDLVWHTHQCSPERYYAVTNELAGKFIKHDDSIVQNKLNTGLKETIRLWRTQFGSEYQVCGCWDCEALQSAIEDSDNKPDWTAIARRVSKEVTHHRSVEVARRKKYAINTVTKAELKS